jgi:uncharacterized protein DUF6088
MRTPDPSSLAGRIASRIAHGGPKRMWTYRDFTDLGASGTAIAAALSRLAKEGTLRRVRRGVYYRPRVTAFGETHPDPNATLEATLRRHDVSGISAGVDAWRRLGLTTQLAGVPMVNTPRRLRLGSVAGHRVNPKVRPSTPHGGYRERAVLDALRNLRRIPGSTPRTVIERLLAVLGEGGVDVPTLLSMALLEPPRVRALLGALLEHARPDDSMIRVSLADLRRSLNPQTTFRIPEAANLLPTSRRWRIK